MKLFTIALLFSLLLSTAYAEDYLTIVDWVIAHNPELQELKRLNQNILRDLKVDLNGNISHGQLQGEGTTTLEEARTRYELGLSVRMPLLSPAEKSERRREEAHLELALRKEVSSLIKDILETKELVAEEAGLLHNLYRELQWLSKRVETGVEYQKVYNEKLASYLSTMAGHQQKKARLQALRLALFAYVGSGDRVELERLLQHIK